MAIGRKTGGGSRKGVPNKATLNAREAIARLVDENAPRMQEWLDAIAAEQGPLLAWKCMTDVIEYHIPKLSRSELAGTVTVNKTARELSDDDLAAIAAQNPASRGE